MAVKPKIIQGGVSFGEDTLANYDEGTWTPTEADKINLTGSLTASGAAYTRIGNMVFARVTITGYTVTNANAATVLVIATTGLPSVANGTLFYGSCRFNGATNSITGSVIDESGGSTSVNVAWKSANASEAGTIALHFQYAI